MAVGEGERDVGGVFGEAGQLHVEVDGDALGHGFVEEGFLHGGAVDAQSGVVVILFAAVEEAA